VVLDKILNYKGGVVVVVCAWLYVLCYNMKVMDNTSPLYLQLYAGWVGGCIYFAQQWAACDKLCMSDSCALHLVCI
jgi:hypothetical protein